MICTVAYFKNHIDTSYKKRDTCAHGVAQINKNIYIIAYQILENVHKKKF